MTITTTEPKGAVTNVRFAVPGHYTSGDEFATFEAAVEAARKGIVSFDYGGHSRAFVDLRCKTADGTGGSSDAPILRWEVFVDRVVEMTPLER